MLGKSRWLLFALAVLGMSSGCRLCERWYERNHEPPNYNRPGYFAPAGGAGCYCPPQCPPGCAPATGANFAPPAVQCPPGCVPAGGY